MASFCEYVKVEVRVEAVVTGSIIFRVVTMVGFEVGLVVLLLGFGFLVVVDEVVGFEVVDVLVVVTLVILGAAIVGCQAVDFEVVGWEVVG